MSLRVAISRIVKDHYISRFVGLSEFNVSGVNIPAIQKEFISNKWE